MRADAMTDETNLPNAGETTTAKAHKPRLTAAQKFYLLAFIKAADSGTPDADVAAAANKSLGTSVNGQYVKKQREAFGLPSVNRPSVGDLHAQLVDAKAYIAELKSQIAKLGEPAA
jgi:hypothetical protein